MQTTQGTISVQDRFADALEEIQEKLASLKVVRGRPISLKGLRGWLFEQTVRTCIEEELERAGIKVEVTEQASIGGRATVDLLVGRAAIEIKVAGFFGNVGNRYRDYRTRIEAKGWYYFYLTLGETYKPYVKVAEEAFGPDRTFFLDREGEWERFIGTAIPLMKSG